MEIVNNFNSSLSLFCSCDQNHMQIPAKEFILNKVAVSTSFTLQLAISFKHELLHIHFLLRL